MLLLDINALYSFLHTRDKCNELKIRMIENNDDEAFDMYNRNTYHKCFIIQKDTRNFKRCTIEVIRRTFVCLRVGFKEFSDTKLAKNGRNP